MMKKRTLVAASLAAALAACSGGGSKSTVTPLTPNAPVVASPTLKIVGIGDSLTAGVQSAALMGANVAPNPIPGSPYPFVQATQPHGFWSLLWQQANGVDPSIPATSPLPLILPPGLSQILVPTATGGLTSITTACGNDNAIAFSLSTALNTRINPQTTPYDLGVPGQTTHEALYMIAPENAQCNIAAGGPLSALAQLVGSESLNFYPVLGNYPTGTTQVAAAASLHAQVATVWLGSNDLLKFIFSAGQLAPTDAGQMQADMVKIIQTLQASGAKVAVANLFPVLSVATFVPSAAYVPTFTALLTPKLGAAAGPTAQGIAAGLAANGLGPNSYLTIGGVSKIIAALPNQAQLGAGDAVPDAVALAVNGPNQAGGGLNDAYNTAIAAAVTQTGATLVDVHALVQVAIAGIPINPPKCCSLQYGGGFFSLDGIHPSNTGYGVLAQAFIATMDAKMGLSIPPITNAQLFGIYQTDIYAPH